MRVKNKKRIAIFLLGSLCFIISQSLLRLPLLNYLQGTTQFTLFYMFNPLLTGILIAFSAGIFEELFRFIFKYFLLKPTKTNILEPVLFGLGHGLVEALIILTPVLSTISFDNLVIAIVERLLAIGLHIGLTVIVWNGFQVNKKAKYLLIAIFIHGLTNSFIPLLSGFENFILIFESLLLGVNLFLIGYMYQSRKLYRLGEEKT